MEHLVETLVNRRELCPKAHKYAAMMARTDSQLTKQFDAEYYLTQWGSEKPVDKRRLERICETRCWLTAVPNRLNLNGTILSAEEFRDNLRLRYNLKPQDIPDICDGCGAKMTVWNMLSNAMWAISSIAATQ